MPPVHRLGLGRLDPELLSLFWVNSLPFKDPLFFEEIVKIAPSMRTRFSILAIAMGLSPGFLLVPINVLFVAGIVAD
jgi:hypothetical protein